MFTTVIDNERIYVIMVRVYQLLSNVV